jgi:hypothetical protein
MERVHTEILPIRNLKQGLRLHQFSIIMAFTLHQISQSEALVGYLELKS